MWQRFHGYDTRSTGKKEQARKKLDFIKIKTFCASRNTIKKVKDSLQNGRNIYKSDVGSAFRICKELLQLKDQTPD